MFLPPPRGHLEHPEVKRGGMIVSQSTGGGTAPKTSLQTRGLQNSERTPSCCFKPSNLWRKQKQFSSLAHAVYSLWIHPLSNPFAFPLRPLQSGPHQLHFTDSPLLWLSWVWSPRAPTGAWRVRQGIFPTTLPWHRLRGHLAAAVSSGHSSLGRPISPAAALGGTCAPSPCSAVPRDGDCPQPCAGSAPALVGPAALPTPVQTIHSLTPLVTLGAGRPCSRVPASQYPPASCRGTDFSPQGQPLLFEFSLAGFSLETIICGDNGRLSPEAGAQAPMSSPATHPQHPHGIPPRTSLPRPGACLVPWGMLAWGP